MDLHSVFGELFKQPCNEVTAKLSCHFDASFSSNTQATSGLN